MFELRFGNPPEPPPMPATNDSVLDFLTLFVTLVGSIAWPVAVVVVVLVFRKQLVKLVGRIIALSGPAGITATFADELEKTRDAAEHAPQTQLPPPAPGLEENDPFLALAKNYPEAAVMNSYKEIERVFEALNDKLGRRFPSVVVMDSLRKVGAITSEIYKLFYQLRVTRNAAVHSERPITPGEALEYRTLVQRLVEELEGVLPKLPDYEPELATLIERSYQRRLGPGRANTGRSAL
ncbi:hypothetical protein [Mesorhizobium sp. IMUNJ 23232]|uniref:hypothetical protein n=1 Tax=Mesorhizobium sp. IMUNJ 23232 TaxID=3376064 RepID=UPI0037A71EB6